MQIQLAWIVDPVSKKSSVSLTNLVLSTLVLVVSIGLHLYKGTIDTSSSIAYFGLSASLYFGRRLSIGNQVFNSQTDKQEKESDEAPTTTNQ